MPIETNDLLDILHLDPGILPFDALDDWLQLLTYLFSNLDLRHEDGHLSF
jgi:hypothetical protein